MNKCVYIYIMCVFVFIGCKENTKKYIDGDERICNDIELAVARSLSSNQNDVKLIGFKTFYVTDEQEKEKLKELSMTMKDSLRNYYFANDGSFFRIYFPLHTAIVVSENDIYYADEYGIIKADKNINIKTTDLTVIGRKLSSNVRGTGTNIIAEDRLLLSRPLTTNLKESSRCYIGTKNANFNYCVFDLGVHETGHDCCGDMPLMKTKTEDSGGNISCVENHGGRNCSDAFDIHEGRCTFRSDICMDYNGWATDCVNGKVSNFPGSDCSIAMARGECWNEIM